MSDIRPISIEDTARYLNLRRKLFSETKYMLPEPEEIAQVTVEQQQRRLQAILSRSNATIMVSECSDQLVGFIAAEGGDYRRNAHCAHLAVGVLQEHRGQGIGTKLLEALHVWAPTVGISRLELTVMVTNENAIRLYQRLGYVIEGLRKHGTFINGAYVDEHYMGKMLF